ncbi:transient receptor potential cation channel subfamily V member 5-like [Saccostrea echinata]|uniref:transient receptor potential cation channel subfamily V member 5-like n=1 Tax=Saccostrea echinata TaxID=191078 RepID=UPI002A7FEB64|nr:transient receptor potential cation channel subfamily V member 5-like [Saccostrea echinata]
MERVKHVRSHTKRMINGNERVPFLEGLGKEIINGDLENAFVMLDTLEKQGNLKWLQMYHNPNHEGETLLHLAVKYHDNESFVRKLSELCPSLLLMARELSLEFCGQTALHMAITKGNIEAIQVMLEVGQFKDIQMATLLHTRATGSRFVNTVMMGQLPLTVAALKGNADIVDILLQYGADILIQNEEGDTVFHSLIKYSATYPEKVVTMLHMLRYLNQKIEKKDRDKSTYDYSGTDMYREPHSFVWFLKNNDNMSPLQLAAKHGVTELFEEILNIKDVYCFISANDGLFDVKEYDVTEIDTVSIIRALTHRHPSSVSYKKSIPQHIHGIAKTVVHSNETQCAPCGGRCCSYPETESILEMLFQFGYDNKDAYRIIELAPVKNIIKMKWQSYQWFFILWMVFHYSFMIMLTIYSVYNVELSIPTGNTGGVNTTAYSENFVYGFRWVSFSVGILYGFIAICLLSAKIRKNNIRGYFLHNLEYIFPMLILSVMMIVDVLWSITEQHDNIPLIIALVCGWWLNIFFLSPIKHFSFFTEMIKRVIIGDLFRFGLVILFGLFSFTAGMYMVFRGSEEMQSDFTSYGSTMMAMFKLGIGIEDINVLYSARIPWVAITIFALFTIFTYLLMLNALIAMMSQTCSLVLEEQFPQWRVQQLSVILFIEDIICLCCFQTILSCAGTKKRIRGSDPITKQIKYEDRYFLEIHSLHMEYATTEDKVWAKKKSNEMQTLHPQLNVNDTLMTTDYHDHPVITSISPIRPSVKRMSSRNLDASVREPIKPTVENAGSDILQPSFRRKKSTKEKKRKPLEKLDEMNTEEEQEENGQYLRQVSSKSPEVLSDRSPTRKPTPKSQRKRYLSENDKELRSQGVQHSPVVEIDPPVYRVNLARVPVNGLNIKNGAKEIEYEIRNLT